MQESPSEASTATSPESTAWKPRRDGLIVELEGDDRSPRGWGWVADLADAARRPLRLLSGLPPMPDIRERAKVEAWMDARHMANARLTAALLAVRRRHPAIRVSSHLCTDGPSLIAAIHESDADIVVLGSR